MFPNKKLQNPIKTPFSSRFHDDEESILDGLPADIFDEGFRPAASQFQDAEVNNGTRTIKDLAGDIDSIIKSRSKGGSTAPSAKSNGGGSSFSPASDGFDFGVIPTTELTSKRDVGIPSKFDSLGELIHVLTTIVYTCSVDHTQFG